MATKAIDKTSASRWATGSAGVILIGTACMHGIGYRPLVMQLAASSLQPAWLAGVKGLWLVYSFHLVILGCLCLAAAIRPGWLAKPALLIVGLVPLADTVVLLGFVGVFVGSVCLGLVTLLVYAGVSLRPS